jgi:hypothetical protein
MTAGVTLRDKLIRARVAVARVAHAAHVTLVTCAVLLSSCAAPAGGGRVLYLESEGYGCGAAPGLGCGLALAPVLAALDEVPGVLAADFARDIAAAVTLDATARERLQAELRVGFEQAFERAHAAGGGVERLWEQFPQSRRDFEQRLAFLSAEQRAGVSAFLDEAFEG